MKISAITRLLSLAGAGVLVRLLTGGNVSVISEGSNLVIKVAPEYRQVVDTVVKLSLDKSALEIAPITLSTY